MISELKLANFRCFDEEVTVRIRPITVILGENNAGKSSLLKCLLMLKQSVNASNQVYLSPNGAEVVLGGIEDLRNRATAGRHLKLALRVDEQGSPPDFLRALGAKRAKLATASYSVEFSVSYSKSLSGGSEVVVLRDRQSMLAEYKSAVDERENIVADKEGSAAVSKDNVLARIKSKIAPNMQFLGDEAGQELSVKRRDVRRGAAGRIRSALSKVAHLSAARDEFTREMDKFGLTTGYVGKQGKNALLELWKNLYQDSEKRAFLLEHLEKVFDIKDIELSEGEVFIACRARSSLTKDMINIANFGFGVSQCMPVFIQGLLMDRYSQLMVEQPEAQVHPTAQLEMGSFFTSLWSKRKVGSIIETHSANLLLRLQHDVKNKKLQPDEVSIAYVHREGGQVKVKNIGITPTGGIEDGIPLRFFDQSLLEMISELKVDRANREQLRK